MTLSKKLFSILGAGLLVLSVGCQLKPTKITEQEPVISESATAESLMKGSPVVLDVRAPFEFNLAHVPGAINVRWEDFSQNNPKSRGLLQNDLYALARRLALIGIDPSSRVLVLGKGAQGMGEEGRIAWTLQVLGVKDVHTLLHTSYREMNTNREIPPTQNKPYWKPTVDETLTVSAKDFKSIAQEEPNVVILDVRLAEEFGLRNLSSVAGIKAKVIHISWTEFFNNKGLAKRDLEPWLAEKGINKDTKILVISNHGVRSGGVTYVLRSRGYSQARNFAGGYEQWK